MYKKDKLRYPFCIVCSFFHFRHLKTLLLPALKNLTFTPFELLYNTVQMPCSTLKVLVFLSTLVDLFISEVWQCLTHSSTEIVLSYVSLEERIHYVMVNPI